MSAFESHLENQHVQYQKYVEAIRPILTSCTIGEKKEIYNDGSTLQLLALRDVAAQLTTPDILVEIGQYVDEPDPDGPYGFIRRYHTVTLSKRQKCTNCNHCQ